jgi:hypothetical protein
MRTLLIGLCIVAVVEAVTSPALSETNVPYGEPSLSPNEPPNASQVRAQDAPRSQPPGFDVVTDGHTSTVRGLFKVSA